MRGNAYQSLGANSRGFSRGGSRPGRPSYPRSSAPRGRGNTRLSGAKIREFIAKVANAPVIAVAEVKHQFSDFEFNAALRSNIGKKGYEIPTPIQDQVIPAIIEGKDVVGVANTGTGKSAAFLLPLIERIMRGKIQRTLVIVPTRELALQLNNELRSFVPGLNIFSTTCIGGGSISAQIRDLRRPHQFVIGTPGRLKDLYERRELRLEKYTAVVLDEVDRMLDMGFIGDIKFLVDKLATPRQSLFFSATLEAREEKVMQQFVQGEIVKVMVKTGEVNKNIQQEVIIARSRDEKTEKIKEILSADVQKAIIFVATQIEADRLSESLQKANIYAESIHGGKQQSKRTRIMRAFRENEFKVLVATDVAARGIDVADISHTINYDTPENLQDYVHRIGRTGRAGNKGVAITFVEN